MTLSVWVLCFHYLNNDWSLYSIYRYCEPEIVQFLTEASFLDPRTKTIPHCTDEHKEAVYTSIQAQMAQVAGFSNQTVNVITKLQVLLLYS